MSSPTKPVLPIANACGGPSCAPSASRRRRGAATPRSLFKSDASHHRAEMHLRRIVGVARHPHLDVFDQVQHNSPEQGLVLIVGVGCAFEKVEHAMLGLIRKLL